MQIILMDNLIHLFLELGEFKTELQGIEENFQEHIGILDDLFQMIPRVDTTEVDEVEEDGKKD